HQDQTGGGDPEGLAELTDTAFEPVVGHDVWGQEEERGQTPDDAGDRQDRKDREVLGDGLQGERGHRRDDEHVQRQTLNAFDHVLVDDAVLVEAADDHLDDDAADHGQGEQRYVAHHLDGVDPQSSFQRLQSGQQELSDDDCGGHKPEVEGERIDRGRLDRLDFLPTPKGGGFRNHLPVVRGFRPVTGRPVAFLLRHRPPRPGGLPLRSYTSSTGRYRQPDG